MKQTIDDGKPVRKLICWFCRRGSHFKSCHNKVNSLRMCECTEEINEE